MLHEWLNCKRRAPCPYSHFQEVLTEAIINSIVKQRFAKCKGKSGVSPSGKVPVIYGDLKQNFFIPAKNLFPLLQNLKLDV